MGWTARAHLTNYWSYRGNPADREAARVAIDRARDIDADFPELYMAEGFYWYWGHRDYERALYNLGRAIEQMPGSDEAHMWRGWAMRRSGSWEDALESIRQSLRLNPRVHVNWAEFGITNQFMHYYEEAREANMQARVVDPQNYWGKIGLANVALQESGDVQTAVSLTVVAQHTGEAYFHSNYMTTLVYAHRFEEALESAREMPDDLEIQLQYISLREMWAARLLKYMDQDDAATAAANAALFRIKRLTNTLGDDYRLDLARAQISPMLGESNDVVRTHVQKSMETQPQDDLESSRFKLSYARIYALAGMTTDSINILEPLFTPPSETSVHTVDLDPAFDEIREAPEFLAMMGRYR